MTTDLDSINLRVKEAKSPLYIIVKEKIRELAEQGVFKPGSKLPRETELAEMFNVSRNTLREALRLAQKEGWVTQKHGVGTFVSRKGAIEQGLEVLESIDSFSKRQQWVCSTEDLHIDTLPAPQKIATILDIPVDTELTRVSRVKTSDGRRIVYVEDFFPASLAPADELQANFKGSVLDFFIARGHPRIDYAWTDITAIYAGETFAEKLAIPESAILLLAEETLFSDQGTPFEYSLNYMLLDFFKFHIVRTLPGTP